MKKIINLKTLKGYLDKTYGSETTESPEVFRNMTCVIIKNGLHWFCCYIVRYEVVDNNVFIEIITAKNYYEEVKNSISLGLKKLGRLSSTIKIIFK